MSAMTPEQFATAHGVDLGALKSLLAYIQIMLERATPEQRRLCEEHPEEFLTTAVQRWHAAGIAFFSMLMHEHTEEAIAARRALAEDVWTTIRTQKGLPT